MSALPLIGPFAGGSWHDQQRLGQILIFAMVAAGTTAVLARDRGGLCPVNAGPRWIMAAVLVLGLLSAARACHPLWALAEIALFVMSIGLGWMITVLRKHLDGSVFDRALTVSIAILCTTLGTRFLAAYLATISSGTGIMNARLLLGGFSNVRFFGQFQTLTMPLLALPFLIGAATRRRHAAVLGLGMLWWAMAIAGGTRGTWMGLSVAITVMSLIGPAGRRWAAGQLTLAGGGFLLFMLLLTWIPAWLDIKMIHHASGRLTTSLSGRAALWEHAFSLIAQHPLLGVGPMHFANLEPSMSAHPHQAILQSAAEWGIPATLALLGLITHAAIATLRVLRATAQSRTVQDGLRLCLAAAILAAGVQAMTDGVLVMPYPQLWLSVLSGWLLALHPRAVGDQAPSPSGRLVWRIITTASTVLLLALAARDAPALTQRIANFRDAHPRQALRPRFWLQGRINTGNRTVEAATGIAD